MSSLAGGTEQVERRLSDGRWRPRPGPGPCRGFTLLELLIALAIFSVVAVLAYGGLGTVLDQQRQTEEGAERLGDLQKTYLIIERDIEQAVPRPVRDQFGDVRGQMTGGEAGLEFTSGGWRNPLGRPRSSMQRIGYTVEDRQLVRYNWLVLDRAQDSEPLQQTLASDITGFSLRYLDAANKWQETWPPENASFNPETTEPELPRAVEVTLDHEYFGEIRWLFRLPE